MSEYYRVLNPKELTSHGHVPGREAMVQILEAGLQAADPYNHAYNLIRIEDNKLIVGCPEYIPEGQPGPIERV